MYLFSEKGSRNVICEMEAR